MPITGPRSTTAAAGRPRRGPRDAAPASAEARPRGADHHRLVIRMVIPVRARRPRSGQPNTSARRSAPARGHAAHEIESEQGERARRGIAQQPGHRRRRDEAPGRVDQRVRPASMQEIVADEARPRRPRATLWGTRPKLAIRASGSGTRHLHADRPSTIPTASHQDRRPGRIEHRLSHAFGPQTRISYVGPDTGEMRPACAILKGLRRSR